MPKPTVIEHGQQFGRFTVLREGDRQPMPSYPKGRRRVWCRCQCGTVKLVWMSDLVNGKTRSCGCWKLEQSRARMTDLNQTPEFITRLAERNSSPEHRARIATATRSPEFRRRVGERFTTHGMYKHPLYDTWYGMLARCYRQEHEHYQDYGGRGISVFAGWHDVSAFIAWVEVNLGPRPVSRTAAGRPEYSLDRIDVNGNYEPGNIRWATWKEQRTNQRPREKRRGAATA